MSDVKTRVPSPESTGGAGPNFEQQVGAFWLSLLLVRGVPPILCRSVVEAVSFQTNYLGWETDDFLVSGIDGEGRRQRLLGQVKRDFTVSDSDAECVKAFTDFWIDFNNANFSPADDYLVLVVLRGTNVILDHFAGLLVQARAAHDFADFQRRLTTSGIVHQTSVRYYKIIKQIVSAAASDAALTDKALWHFLRCIQVLSLDLGTSTRQTEAQITSLLAHTATAPDKLGRARATFGQLMQIAGEAAPEARTLSLDALPLELQRAHGSLESETSVCIAALKSHSSVVLRCIQQRVAGIRLPRTRLTQEVIAALTCSQVILVSGPAGSGKSAAAKAVVELLAPDHFVFAFRAEEFAHAHLDETLSAAKIPSNTAGLSAVLAGQCQKVMLVESVERLLEHSTRDAFSDLLAVAKEDATWRIVLTCRDYSQDLVADTFLDRRGIAWTNVVVPELDDGELDEVQAHCVSLATPLATTAFRELLRNPYFLDKTAQISWQTNDEYPKNRREFRQLFWRDVIRKDAQRADGMPSLRQTVFAEVARRRAQTLDMYANCQDLPPVVRDRLLADSILVQSPDNEALCAPAHDVLEDWAILRWIDETFHKHRTSLDSFADELGSWPAIRRTYRVWIAEQVELIPKVADEILSGCVTATSLPAHFRDDTFVSLLRSKTADLWLSGHEKLLFDGDRATLSRLIHLLRVACVEARPMPTEKLPEHMTYLPEGDAWACILRLVAGNLDKIDSADQGLLVGLLSDWSKLISNEVPYPVGSESAVAVAHHLLPSLGRHRDDEHRRQVLTVIAKLPNVMTGHFVQLLSPTEYEDARDPVREELRKIVLSSFDGIPACRDQPRIVADAFRDELILQESDLTANERYGYSHNLEPLFGLKDEHHGTFSLETAFRGPTLFLLRHDFRGSGLQLILDTINHATEWYAKPRIADRVEPPYQIVMRFTDGSEQPQWANGRLWNLYRGTSVGPAMLKSVLMATEHFLFEVANIVDIPMDPLLLEILRATNSASLTAVVASVAVAFPSRCVETLLTLLRTRDCFSLDRARMVADGSPPSTWGLRGLRQDVLALIAEKERKDADTMPHRQRDLENAIMDLQLRGTRDRVQAEIDAQLSHLSTNSTQTRDDQEWRLALHRMDLRQYDMERVAPPSDQVPDSSDDGGRPQSFILLTPKPVDADLQPAVQDAQERWSTQERWLRPLNWGLSILRGDDKAAPAAWREMLTESRKLSTEDSLPEESRFLMGGPAIVAAVCVRDHWDDLGSESREWCAAEICAAVEEGAADWNHLARVQRNAMSPDRPCAMLIWKLLASMEAGEGRERCLAIASLTVTHPVAEVRTYGAEGIAQYAWKSDRELALRAIAAIAFQAAVVEDAAAAERQKHYRDEPYRNLDEIEAEVALRVRPMICGTAPSSTDALSSLNFADWFGTEAALLISTILLRAADEATATTFFAQLSSTIAAWWAEHDDHSSRRQRNFEVEFALERKLESYALLAPLPTAESVLEPLVAAVPAHSREVARFMEGLICRQDQLQKNAQFWTIWQLFAGAICNAPWTAWLDDRHGHGEEVIRAIFLGIQWNDGIRSWQTLVGNESRPLRLFQRLPPSQLVTGRFVRLLYDIGETALPGAFIALADKVVAARPTQLFGAGNTEFMLETLLRRWVYGRPLELKRQPNLREAIIVLLDALVDAGSSAAYRMRDDFVTPLPTDQRDP